MIERLLGGDPLLVEERQHLLHEVDGGGVVGEGLLLRAPPLRREDLNKKNNKSN